MTSQPDEVMTRVGEGIQLSQSGERDSARSLFAGLWDEVGADGDAFHRCAIAHWAADLEDDEQDELRWDLRALEAADSITDERAQEGGLTSSVLAMYPSLHLNLGDVYRRLGDPVRARSHLAAGRVAAGALGEDGYSEMIRGGLDRLEARLATERPVEVIDVDDQPTGD